MYLKDFKHGVLAPGCQQCKDNLELHQETDECPADCEECHIQRWSAHQWYKKKGDCTPECQKYKEDKQGKEEYKAQEEKQTEQRYRVERPWLFETYKPMTEPPDISYRKLILKDLEGIDRLFYDEGLHFTERCLK